MYRVKTAPTLIPSKTSPKKNFFCGSLKGFLSLYHYYTLYTLVYVFGDV